MTEKHSLCRQAFKEAELAGAAVKPPLKDEQGTDGTESEAEFELAKRYGLIATPALVIDGGTVMYGVPLPVALAARVDASRRMARADGEAR